MNDKYTILFGCLSVVLFLGMGGVVNHYGKQEMAKLGSHLASVHSANPCLTGGNIEHCVSKAPGPIVAALIGDSHSGHWAESLSAGLSIQNYRMFAYASAGCPPLAGILPYRKFVLKLECQRVLKNEFSFLPVLIKKEQIKLVILASRWSSYLAQPDTEMGEVGAGSLWYVNKPLPGSRDVGVGAFSHSESVSRLEQGLVSTINELRKDNPSVKFLLIASTPEMTFNVPQCLYRRSARECGISRGQFESRRADALRVLHKVSSMFAGVSVVDVGDVICSKVSCPAAINGRPLYSDDDHLSRFGADYSRAKILAEIVKMQ